MYATITREPLISTLQTAMLGNASVKRAHLPILACVRLMATTGSLTVSATDLEMAVTTTTGAAVTTPGIMCVDGKALLAAVKGMPRKARVTLATTDAGYQAGQPIVKLAVRCDGLTTTLDTWDVDDYPLLPEMPANGTVAVLPAADVARMIGATAPHASTDDARPVFTGIFTQLHDDHVTLAAADGFRLAVATTPLQSPPWVNAAPPCGIGLIVPARCMVALARVVGKGDGPVVVDCGDPTKEPDRATFTYGDTTMTTRLISGKYVNYQQIIPAGHAATVTATTTELAAALDTFKRAAKGIGNDVLYVHEAEGGLVLSMAGEGSMGAFVRATVTTTTAEPMAPFAVNPAMLASAVASMGSVDRVALGTPDQACKPMTITAVGRDDVRVVVMPMTTGRDVINEARDTARGITRNKYGLPSAPVADVAGHAAVTAATPDATAGDEGREHVTATPAEAPAVVATDASPDDSADDAPTPIQTRDVEMAHLCLVERLEAAGIEPYQPHEITDDPGIWDIGRSDHPGRIYDDDDRNRDGNLGDESLYAAVKTCLLRNAALLDQYERCYAGTLDDLPTATCTHDDATTAGDDALDPWELTTVSYRAPATPWDGDGKRFCCEAISATSDDGSPYTHVCDRARGDMVVTAESNATYAANVCDRLNRNHVPTYRAYRIPYVVVYERDETATCDHDDAPAVMTTATPITTDDALEVIAMMSDETLAHCRYAMQAASERGHTADSQWQHDGQVYWCQCAQCHGPIVVLDGAVHALPTSCQAATGDDDDAHTALSRDEATEIARRINAREVVGINHHWGEDARVVSTDNGYAVELWYNFCGSPRLYGTFHTAEAYTAFANERAAECDDEDDDDGTRDRPEPASVPQERATTPDGTVGQHDGDGAPVARVAVASVAITFTESAAPYDAGDDLPLVCDSLATADDILRTWARTAPDTGAYDKTDFTILFADGETYEGRYDLQRQDATRGDLIGAHVRAFCAFYAGQQRPAHLSAEQYTATLSYLSAEERAACTRFLETYDLGSQDDGDDAPTAPDAHRQAQMAKAIRAALAEGVYMQDAMRDYVYAQCGDDDNACNVFLGIVPWLSQQNERDIRDDLRQAPRGTWIVLQQDRDGNSPWYTPIMSAGDGQLTGHRDTGATMPTYEHTFQRMYGYEVYTMRHDIEDGDRRRENVAALQEHDLQEGQTYRALRSNGVDYSRIVMTGIDAEQGTVSLSMKRKGGKTSYTTTMGAARFVQVAGLAH